jgi:arylsulfatase A-like enzyme
VLEHATGKPLRQFEHPCLGSWVSYALGTANKNLPTFVNIGRPSSPVQLTGGYIGASYSATPFQPGNVPIPNLLPPGTGTTQQRERQMQALFELDKQFREDYAAETEIAGRTRAFELAASMMLKAPAIVDFSTETQNVKDLYGIGEKETDDFGRQLLLARRLVENDVRFIQICHAGGGNGRWDSHDDMKSHEPLCRAVDKPVSGLIRDLKQRGLLDSTLVVFTSEFGRTPWSQNTTGRDHNAMGFTTWLSGGGVKGGIVEGATDEVGYRAVEKPHYISDLQSTILQQVGLNYKKMDFVVNGRPFHLVEEGEGPIQAIL